MKYANEHGQFCTPQPLGIRRWGVFLAIVLTAFSMYARMWRQAPIMTLDSPSYMLLAQQIRAGHITQVWQRTPGLPLLMVLLSSDVTLSSRLFYAHLALYFAGLLITLLLLVRFGVNRLRAAVVLAVGLFPCHVQATAFADSEPLCEFFVILSVAFACLWLQSRRFAWLMAFGAASVAAALVRPTYQLLCPLLAAVLVLANAFLLKREIPTGRLLLMLAVPISLWAATLGGYSAWNYERFGYFGTNCMAPYQLSTRTASFIEDLPYDYAPLRSILVRYRDEELVRPHGNHTAVDYIHRAMPEVIRSFHGDRVAAFHAVERANTHLILHRPMSYLIEVLRAMAIYWLPVEYPIPELTSQPWRGLGAVLQLAESLLLFFVTTGVLGVAAICLVARRTGGPVPLPGVAGELSAAFLLALAVIGYTFALSCFAGTGIPRYRVTSQTVMLAAIVLGFEWLRRAAANLQEAANRRREAVRVLP
jgi:hypothetical protein